MAFELIFAFDEVISLGHKENVTIAQVKQYVEMESHEERLHKRIIESKINETKDIMKRKANEIEKNRVCVVIIFHCFRAYFCRWYFSNAYSVWSVCSVKERDTLT